MQKTEITILIQQILIGIPLISIFVLPKIASLSLYTLFSWCPSITYPFSHLLLYSCLLFCSDLCASPFISPLTASFCLILTSDFSCLWSLCVSIPSSLVFAHMSTPLPLSSFCMMVMNGPYGWVDCERAVMTTGLGGEKVRVRGVCGGLGRTTWRK